MKKDTKTNVMQSRFTLIELLRSVACFKSHSVKFSEV